MIDEKVDKKKILCPCCGGTGTQVKTSDGIRVICPCCQGAGTKPVKKVTWK